MNFIKLSYEFEVAGKRYGNAVMVEQAWLDKADDELRLKLIQELLDNAKKTYAAVA